MMNDLHLRNTSQLSFLKARDPSIITGNLVQARENLRINLALNKFQESTIVEEQDTNINVYLRLKNAKDIENLYKIDKNEIHCYVPNDSNNVKNTKEENTILRKYKFSHIFTPDSTQEEVFNNVVKPKIFKFINGENSTLMTYGASGSGKTFTIVGTALQPGLIPRALEYFFRTLPELSLEPLIKPTQSGEVKLLSDISRQEEISLRNVLLNLALSTIDNQHITTYQQMQQRLSTEPTGVLDDLTNVILGVWVSFAEIYNECIYDLLAPQTKTNTKKKLQLGSFNENTYIKNLTNVSISSGIEAYQILQYGLHNLNYAATSINSRSSRSHSIFTIKIAQLVKDTGEYRLNYFNFCDLAGSEKLKKTLNAGDRLKESNSINTSLLVLGRCINCIRQSQKQNVNKIIPFRDSKLTRLFQRSLTGYEKLSMIVNMNPASEMFDESQHVLNFSALTKDIVVKQMPIKLLKKNRFSDYMQSKNAPSCNIKPIQEESEISKLQDIIDELHADLEKQSKHFVEYELNIREEIVADYRVLFEDIEKQHQKEIAQIEAQYRKHIEMLQNRYVNTKQSSEVINLDSSTEEDETFYRKENSNLIKQIYDLKKQVSDLKSENTLLISKKDGEILELQKTLHDAERTFNEMETTYLEKINKLEAENMALKEANSDLSAEIDGYSRMYNLDNLFD